MARSYKKAIIKDKKPSNNMYHKIVRRVSKHALKQGKEIPDPKVIVNDYDYCDYIFDMENISYCDEVKTRPIKDQIKYRRK